MVMHPVISLKRSCRKRGMGAGQGGFDFNWGLEYFSTKRVMLFFARYTDIIQCFYFFGEQIFF